MQQANQSDFSEVLGLIFFKRGSDEVSWRLDACKTDFGSVPKFGNY